MANSCQNHPHTGQHSNCPTKIIHFSCRPTHRMQMTTNISVRLTGFFHLKHKQIRFFIYDALFTQLHCYFQASRPLTSVAQSSRNPSTVKRESRSLNFAKEFYWTNFYLTLKNREKREFVINSGNTSRNNAELKLSEG